MLQLAPVGRLLQPIIASKVGRGVLTVIVVGAELPIVTVMVLGEAEIVGTSLALTGFNMQTTKNKNTPRAAIRQDLPLLKDPSCGGNVPTSVYHLYAANLNGGSNFNSRTSNTH